jgi:predicted AlkP superfamily pyrophosphatase or phosphodiesterase
MQSVRLCIVLLLMFGRGLAEETYPLLLISLDGCRHDYLAHADTPNLDRLAKSGVRASGLVPPFPSKTFPSHYTLVTGLYPDHHGIIDNVIYDPTSGSTFKLSDRVEIHQSKWWQGEPIWVTVQKMGMKSAPFLWPGSEAEIAGYRPTYWEPYDHHMPHAKKVSRILGFFDLPDTERPDFLTLYYPDIDEAGHRHGPNSPEVRLALERIDHSLGQLLAGLESRQLLGRVHIIVVSDHGMTSIDTEHVIILDEYVDLADLTFVRTGELGGLMGSAERLEAIEAKLRGAHPHLQIYRRDGTPSRLHYGSNNRVPPLLLLPDIGWLALTREQATRRKRSGSKGAHGYDGQNPDMHGIFLATGPRIASGTALPSVRAIDLYNLMCKLLGVTAAPNDGGPFLVDTIGLN